MVNSTSAIDYRPGRLHTLGGRATTVDVAHGRHSVHRKSRRALLAGSAALAGVAGLGWVGCRDEQAATVPSAQPDQGRAVAATETPKSGGVFRISSTGALGTLDPQTAVNAVNSQTTPLVHAYLLRSTVLAADAGVLWDLGRSYELADPTTWIFKLRPNVNIAPNARGIPQRPLDAEDVKANIERGGDPRSGSPGARWFQGWVARVEAPDASTVRIVTKAPYAWVLANLGNYTFGAVAPREWLASPDLKTATVGAGPFMVKEWQQDRGSLLEKNPTYHMTGLPYLDQYEVRSFADKATSRIAFVSSQIETYLASNVTEAKELQRTAKDLQLSEDPSFGYQTFWMNTRVAPWNDPRVRRAVARAINRQELIQIIGHGQGEPIGPVTSAMKPYGLPQDELARLQPFNIAEARQLFQAAGVKEFSFVHSTANINVDYVTIFVRQMQAAGVTAKPEPLDPGTWVQGLFQSRHSASHVTPPEFTDPDFAMNAHGSRGPIGSDNYATGYSDPEIDAAIRRAAGIIDERERVTAYQDLQRLVLQRDPAWVNYFAGRDNNLSQPYVRGPRRGIGSLGTYFAREYWLNK